MNCEIDKKNSHHVSENGSNTARLESASYYLKNWNWNRVSKNMPNIGPNWRFAEHVKNNILG